MLLSQSLEKATTATSGQNYAIGKTSILKACTERFHSDLGKLLNHVFSRIDDSLFDAADKALNSQSQSTYFNAMRRIRINKNKIINAFFNTLDNVNSETQAAPQAAQSTSFQLVDLQELEESIAIDGAAKRATEISKQQLFMLEQRLTFLLDGQPEHRFSPQAICNSFKAGVQNLELELKVLLIVYKLFDKHALVELPQIYERLNRFLIEQNILPNLNYSTGNRDMDSEYAAESAPAPAWQSAGDPDRFEPEQVTQTQDVYSAIAAMLSHRQPTNHPNAGSAFVPDGIAGPTLIDALTRIQANFHYGHGGGGAAQGYARPGRFAQRLVQHINAQSPTPVNGIATQENSTIDMVALLFDFILEDSYIPGSMRALIGRLQIPVLKVAMLDKAFFSSKNHPARLLVNEFAKAAMHWNDDREINGLYQHMELLINRLTREFNDDMGVFAHALQEFRNYIQQERYYYKVVEERTVQSCESEDRKQSARQRIISVFREKLDHVKCPKILRSILLGPWRSYLFQVLLNKDDDAWRQAVSVIDLALWSVSPKQSPSEQKQMISAIPELLAKLRKGLLASGQSPEQIKQWFQELQKCHMTILKQHGDQSHETVNESTKDATAVDDPHIEEIIIETPIQDTIQQVPPDDQFIQQARTAEVGTWFGFIHDEDEKSVERAKLSWKSRVNENYIFVNRKGVKVMDKTVYGLAAELRRGSAFVLEELPLLDRAMDAIMTGLQQETVTS